MTAGFSGASLENLLNEAAISAALRGGGDIGAEDVKRAFRRTAVGEDRPSVASDHEKRIIAAHEAGHALVSRLLLPENHLARVSILPSGSGAAGYNLTVPAEVLMPGRRELQGQICVLLAGRAAEAAVFGEEAVTAGAASDLARATELAAGMALELGMAGEPAVSLRVLMAKFGGAGDAQERCRGMLDGLYRQTCTLIEGHREALDALSAALLEREALDGADAEAIIDAALSNESQESA